MEVCLLSTLPSFPLNDKTSEPHSIELRHENNGLAFSMVLSIRRERDQLIASHVPL